MLAGAWIGSTLAYSNSSSCGQVVLAGYNNYSSSYSCDSEIVAYARVQATARGAKVPLVWDFLTSQGNITGMRYFSRWSEDLAPENCTATQFTFYNSNEKSVLSHRTNQRARL